MHRDDAGVPDRPVGAIRVRHAPEPFTSRNRLVCRGSRQCHGTGRRSGNDVSLRIVAPAVAQKAQAPGLVDAFRKVVDRGDGLAHRCRRLGSEAAPPSRSARSFAENLSELGGKLMPPIGLLQQMNVRVETSVMHDYVLAVP